MHQSTYKSIVNCFHMLAVDYTNYETLLQCYIYAVLASSVEGITIETTDEVLNYCRHLTNSEIRLLVLQRILNRNPVEKSIPVSFVPIYNTWAPEHQKEMIDECKQSLCRALFNKNAADGFWALFEGIYTIIVAQPVLSVQQIFNVLDKTLKEATPDFDIISLKYFISVIKDGIQNDY